MTVSDIQGHRIKVSLTNIEVLSCFGSYEKLFSMSGTVKSAIHSLLEDIISKKDCADFEKMLVEVKAKKNIGCVITVSLLNLRKPKSYMFDFSDTDSLTDAILMLYKNRTAKRLESSLYKMPDYFRLVINSHEYKPVFSVLNEYCIRQSKCDIELAYTQEYGKILIPENAIEIYGSAFAKGS